jgi:hypothetical protein
MVPYSYHVLTPREKIEEDLEVRRHMFPRREGCQAQLRAIMTWGACDRLKNLKVPTLVIHGDSDRLIPTGNAHLLASKLPNAKLIELAHAGHIFLTDQTQAAIKEILSFLHSVLLVWLMAISLSNIFDFTSLYSQLSVCNSEVDKNHTKEFSGLIVYIAGRGSRYAHNILKSSSQGILEFVEAILEVVWLRLTSSLLASCYRQACYVWCWMLYPVAMIIPSALYILMARSNALYWLRSSYFQFTHSGVKRTSIQSEARSGA